MANSLGEIKSMEAFEQRYLPYLAKAKKAMKMTKQQFWPWYMKFTKEEREKVEKEMVAEAQRLEGRASHIWHLLYD